MRIERANAKINLYLNIVGRRENGYHDIVSIMQAVSLCDLVSIEFYPGEHTSVSLTASGNDRMPTDCRNLAWRAAERYLQRIDRRGEVRLSIEKHIPMAAGLAGGSTDAAAVLRGLNLLCGSPLSLDELCELGASMGADIPFCIKGGAALVTGIGECLTDIPPMPSCPLVVACQGEGVSTPVAYGKLDALHDHFVNAEPYDSRVDQIVDRIKNNEIEPACSGFYNIFEEVVPHEQPFVNAIKQTMIEHGAIRSMMSGSGPSVFGVFRDLEAASAACEALRRSGAAAFVCEPKK